MIFTGRVGQLCAAADTAVTASAAPASKFNNFFMVCPPVGL
jgi:hypothetical protein